MSPDYEIGLRKDDGETYLYRFDGDSVNVLFRTFGLHAADQDLSFTWYAAAVLSQKDTEQS